MKLQLSSINDSKSRKEWENLGYDLPKFDIQAMREKTFKACKWVHFGGGNIFRAFISARLQDLLNQGLEDTGIIVGEGFDPEVVEESYNKVDNLCVNVVLKADGTVDKQVLASVAKAMVCSTQNPQQWKEFVRIFTSPELQMASFTITEKGYATEPAYVQEDIKRGPNGCTTLICMITSLLNERYKAGKLPIAVVSMDNCSKNGEKLANGVKAVANAWLTAGLVDKGFISYIEDSNTVSFPWSMIDKITPRPDASVCEMLKKDGLEGMDPVITAKRSYVSAFVNSEECEYLVIENNFPNGKPALDKVGIYFTDRETVTKVERMKVCTCLNPLHTAMSVMGCVLGFNKISDEMKDEDIVAYIKRLGYVEGLPVVTDPGILSPKAFIDDVVYKRLPNPFMPDTPQRIATDTSQKLSIRFGETFKEYKKNNMDLETLKVLPLVLASWMRYVLGVNDNGEAFELSPDPLLESAQADMASVKFGQKASDSDLKKIMEREDIWGYNLFTSELKDKVIANFNKLNNGPGAVRKTLHEVVSAC